MARKIIKRFLPDDELIRSHRVLRPFGGLLQDPNLWHINRRSASLAFFIGLFIAFMPIPVQMLAAGMAAIVFRANLPLSVSLVWVSNPLTMAPMFFMAFELGCWILDVPPRGFRFQFHWEWFTEGFADVWRPLLLGCTVLGLAAGLAGALFIRIFWRVHAGRRWKERRRRRRNCH